MKALKLRGREKILSARIATLLVFATLLLLAPLAQAVPITIEITGEVTSASGSGLPGTIYAGIGFTGTYTYDSSVPDSSASSYIGLYVFDSPYGMNISLGGIEFETSPSHIGQFEIKISDNGPNLDYYTVWSNQNTPLSDGTTISWISWGVYGPNEMLSSTDLPITAPVIDRWDNRLFIYGRDIYGNGYNIYGTVSQAVPEPLTGVLMMIGVLFCRRRRKAITVQKPRGIEGYLSARFVTFFVFATLLLSAPLAQAVPITTEITGNVTSIGGPASAEFDFTISSVYINGYFPLNDQSLLVEGEGVEGIYAYGNSYIEIQNTTPYEWKVGGVGRAILYDQSSIKIYGGETNNVYTQNNSNMNIYDGWLGWLIIADDSSATLYGGNIGNIRNTQFVPLDTEINLEVVCKSWTWDESTNHIIGIWCDNSSFDISLTDTSWENFESYRMIDHISFTVIPEPSTITLLLTMGIFFLRRRR